MRPVTTRKHKPLVVAGIFAIVFLLIFSVYAFRRLGVWLIEQDPLQTANAIVVLSGGLPYRALEAAKLYRKGYAPEVWVSRPTGPQAQLQSLGVQFTGEEIYNQQILLHQGVPPNAVHILETTIINTEQEVHAISDELRRTGGTRVIIVTSPYHTRRVETLWKDKDIVGPELHAIVRSDGEPYDMRHWWRNTRDSLAVSREFLGLLNAWAGLPVRPHDH